LVETLALDASQPDAANVEPILDPQSPSTAHADGWSAKPSGGGRRINLSRRGMMAIAGGLAVVVAVASFAFATAGGSTPSPSPAPTRPLTKVQMAQDRNAQADLRNALIAAKVAYTDSSTYAGAVAAKLGAIEPGLCYVRATTASVFKGASCISGHGRASISISASAVTWSAARLSASGTCFWTKDDVTVGTTYGSGLPCTATAATAASAPRFPGEAPPTAAEEACSVRYRLGAALSDGAQAAHRALQTHSLAVVARMSGRAGDDFRLVAELATNPSIARSARDAARLFGSASDAIASGRFDEGTTRFDQGVDVAVTIEKAFNRSDDGSC
jgi:hypothetical protein